MRNCDFLKFNFLETLSQKFEHSFLDQSILRELFKKDFLTQTLKHSSSSLYEKYMLHFSSVFRNEIVLKELIEKNIMNKSSFRNFLNNLLNLDIGIEYLMMHQKAVKTFFDKDFFTTSLVKEFLSKLTQIQLCSVYMNEFFLFEALNKNLLTFDDLLNDAKKQDRLELFLQHFFNKNSLETNTQAMSLLENSLNLKSVLDSIRTVNELYAITNNAKFLEILLLSCIIDESYYTKFSNIVGDYQTNFFDFINHCITHHYNTNLSKIVEKECLSEFDKKLLDLNEMTKYIYTFNKNFRVKLLELSKLEDSQKKKLEYVNENQLENSFGTFEELLVYLNKQEKKHSLSI